MEGDAGASGRLNLTDAENSSPSEVTPEDSKESDGGADQTGTEVTPEDSKESDGGADQIGTEGTPEVLAETAGADGAESVAKPGDDEGNEDGAAVSAAPIRSRLDRRWLIAITAVLILLAGGVGYGGYRALTFHQESRAVSRNDAAAMRAAENCVAATQAPDIAAMSDAARKIIECSTGDFGAQAALYSGLLTEAYQAANAHVQVSDMHAAVERNNHDGSIDVLVALRTKVSNSATQDQEQGYRLRVTMSLADGQYKISKLDQVAK